MIHLLKDQYPSQMILSHTPMIAPSVFLTALTISSTILFTFNHSTPIVLSANRKMTAIQLTTHLLLFTIPIFLFLDTTPIMCITGEIFLGISFSVTIFSINISKSQKIYKIVGKQVRMMKSKIFLTNSSEWSVILAVNLCCSKTLKRLPYNNGSMRWTN